MSDAAPRIAVEDPRDELVQSLLRRHLAFAADHSPPFMTLHLNPR